MLHAAAVHEVKNYVADSSSSLLARMQRPANGCCQYRINQEWRNGWDEPDSEVLHSGANSK